MRPSSADQGLCQVSAVNCLLVTRHLFSASTATPNWPCQKPMLLNLWGNRPEGNKHIFSWALLPLTVASAQENTEYLSKILLTLFCIFCVFFFYNRKWRTFSCQKYSKLWDLFIFRREDKDKTTNKLQGFTFKMFNCYYIEGYLKFSCRYKFNYHVG